MTHTMAAMIGLAALGLAGCGQSYTVWEVAKDANGTRATAVEAGLDRAACELIRQARVRGIQGAAAERTNDQLAYLRAQRDALHRASEEATTPDAVHQGTEAEVANLRAQHDVRIAAAVPMPDGLLQGFPDGTQLSLEAVCLPAGKRPT